MRQNLIKRSWWPWLVVLLGILWVFQAQAGTTVPKVTVKLIVTNAQGTVVATMTPQGQVTYTAAYRPYGQQVKGTPQAGPGYTGHVNDPDTGLVYMQQRYYDPTIQRFISPDPIRPAPGNIYNFNRFAYANNNPIVNIDPDGRETGRTLQAEWRMMGAKPNLTPDPVGKAIAAANLTLIAGPVAYLIAPEATVAAVRLVVSKVISRTTRADDSADAAKSSPSITSAYKRPSGATTTAQRASVQGKPCVDCGAVTPKQVADHKNPLVKEYYETGTIDTARMRSTDAVQPQCPTCSAKQGARMSHYSRQMKKDWGLDQHN